MVVPPSTQSNLKFPWPTSCPAAPGAGPPRHGPDGLTDGPCDAIEMATTPAIINMMTAAIRPPIPLIRNPLRGRGQPGMPGPLPKPGPKPGSMLTLQTLRCGLPGIKMLTMSSQKAKIRIRSAASPWSPACGRPGPRQTGSPP